MSALQTTIGDSSATSGFIIFLCSYNKPHPFLLKPILHYTIRYFIC